MESSEWRAAFDEGAHALRAPDNTRVPPLCHSYTLHPYERTGRSSMNRFADSNGDVETKTAPLGNGVNGDTAPSLNGTNGETVPAGAVPGSGRDAHGRFAKGNPGGPGNPFARQSAALRRRVQEKLTEDELDQIVDRLIAQA